uniref:Uncharacterized protein n=1 Tax=Arundo donax TaxID=35708 RepID=A0A0A9BLR5_ARUDO
MPTSPRRPRLLASPCERQGWWPVAGTASPAAGDGRGIMGPPRRAGSYKASSRWWQRTPRGGASLWVILLLVLLLRGARWRRPRGVIG